jgi:hypothetical protein
MVEHHALGRLVEAGDAVEHGVLPTVGAISAVMSRAPGLERQIVDGDEPPKRIVRC